jgi:hypothetical protein
MEEKIEESCQLNLSLGSSGFFAVEQLKHTKFTQQLPQPVSQIHPLGADVLFRRGRWFRKKYHYLCHTVEVSGRAQVKFAGPICWPHIFVVFSGPWWTLPTSGKYASVD